MHFVVSGGCLYVFNLLLAVLLLEQHDQVHASFGFLNVEELDAAHYSLTIADDPISILLKEQEEEKLGTSFMYVASNIGQLYMCQYNSTHQAQSNADEEDHGSSISITDLLEPMKGTCLFKTKDWWSYEFCFGDEITQFHLHEGQRVGEIISLGKYESDQKWDIDEMKKAKKSKLSQYHTQKYINGTLCDLTGHPRQTEVRFSCREGELDHIGGIAELEPCSYILFIYTSSVCLHPYMRPAALARPSPIQCRPVVSQTAFEQHLARAEQAKLETANEQLSQDNEKDILDDKLEQAKQAVLQQLGQLFNFEGLNMEDLNVELINLDEGSEANDLLSKSLQTLSKSQAESAGSADPQSDPRPLNEQKNQEAPEPSVDGSPQSPAAKAVSESDQMDTELERELDALFKEEAETGGLNEGAPARVIVSKFRENIKHFVSSQFTDIIEEARQELEAQGEALSSDLDMEALRKTMSEYLDGKLDAMEAVEKMADSTVPDPVVPSDQPGSEAQEVQQTQGARNAGEKGDPSSVKVKRSEPRRQIISIEHNPTQLEVEMLKFDSAEPHIAMSSSRGADSKTSEAPRVIAVIKPMQLKGTRQEEKMHTKLEEGYKKRWDNDEL